MCSALSRCYQRWAVWLTLCWNTQKFWREYWKQLVLNLKLFSHIRRILSQKIPQLYHNCRRGRSLRLWYIPPKLPLSFFLRRPLAFYITFSVCPIWKFSNPSTNWSSDYSVSMITKAPRGRFLPGRLDGFCGEPINRMDVGQQRSRGYTTQASHPNSSRIARREARSRDNLVRTSGRHDW